jgi:hypothetical protein
VEVEVEGVDDGAEEAEVMGGWEVGGEDSGSSETGRGS